MIWMVKCVAQVYMRNHVVGRKGMVRGVMVNFVDDCFSTTRDTQLERLEVGGDLLTN